MDGQLSGVRGAALDGYTYTTWSLSYNRLTPDAASLACLCAHLHHTGITERLFRDARSSIHKFRKPKIPLCDSLSAAHAKVEQLLQQFVSVRSGGTWNSFAFRQCMQEACSFSLFEYNEVGQVYDKHPLVHDGLRSITQSSLKAAFVVAAVVEHSNEDHEQLVQYVPHVERIVLSMGHDEKKHELHPILTSPFATAMAANGHFSAAQTLQAQVVKQTRTTLGHQHLDHFAALLDLAEAESNLGHYQIAEGIQTTVLHALAGRPDVDRVQINSVLLSLAVSKSHLGHYPEAEEIQTNVVNNRLLIDGGLHPQYVSALFNLAVSQSKLGKHEEAEGTEQKALQCMQERSGEDDPQYITVLSNHALTKSHLGNHEDALKMQNDVLRQRQLAFGESHPLYIQALSSLATIHPGLGDHSTATVLREEVLENRRTTLGQKRSLYLTALLHSASS